MPTSSSTNLEGRVEQGAKLRVVADVLAMALLDGELDRRQRVLDLVRQPLRHLLPRADALQVLDARPRLLHLAEHPVEDAGELRQLVGAGDRNAHVEVARRDPVDRVRQAVDSPRDPAREKEPQHHGRHDGDPEENREGLEVSGVDARALLLELRVRLVRRPGALELLLVAPVEGEGRHEGLGRAVAREGSDHLELALGRFVEGVPPVARCEHVARAVVDLE